MTAFWMQWQQLDHKQTICSSLQTDNHASMPSFNFYRPMLFLTPNQQCQSTEGKNVVSLIAVGSSLRLEF